MRFKEILKEKQELELAKQHSIPNVSHVGVAGDPKGPTNYYHKYRLGVAMAGSPDWDHDYPVDGEFVDHMVMVAYTQADVDIVNKANEKFGYKQQKLSTRGSQEMPDTNAVSPVSNWRK